MSMKYIRDYYGVPAKRGGEVIYTYPKKPRKGRITSAMGGRLRVLLEGDKRPKIFHPTWHIEYL